MSLALVTGASGHLGAALVRALLAGGRRVRALVHTDTRALTGLEVELVRGDVAAPETLTPAVRDVDVVFHLAGLISLGGDPRGRVGVVNVDGVRNVARAALAARVRRFVHVSSVHAFDSVQSDQLITEASGRVARGRSAYGLSKWSGEQALAEVTREGLAAVTLHPSGVLGPFDFKPSLMGRFLLALYARRLPALVHGGFDWLDVRDVARTAMAAAQDGRVGESYLVTGTFASVVELARLAAEVTGIAPPRLCAPMWLARLGAAAVDGYVSVTGRDALWSAEALATLRGARRFDATKARTELGHTTRSLLTTVRDSYAWFFEAGMLPRLSP